MRRLIVGMLLTSSASALLCVTVPAQAQEDRIRQLERRVEQLEKRMNRQTAPNTEDKKGVARTGEWRSRANWRTLKRGMTESDVQAILGEPQKIDVNQSFFTWHWNYPGGPEARFMTNDRRLEGWSEP